MSLLIQIAVKLNKIIKDEGLRELGQLEQDLVFGDAGTKDVIKFLTTNEVITEIILMFLSTCHLSYEHETYTKRFCRM